MAGKLKSIISLLQSTAAQLIAESEEEIYNDLENVVFLNEVVICGLTPEKAHNTKEFAA